MSEHILTQSNGLYLPASALADTSRRKEFYGDIDPSTVSGVVLGFQDVWNKSLSPTTPPVAQLIGAPPSTQTVLLGDFIQNGAYALFLGNQSYEHAYKLEMPPGTSTRADEVAAETSSTTTPYRLLFSGDKGSVATGLRYGNFDLHGTDQGHVYMGWTHGYTIGTYIHNVTVTGIPGATATPPYETMSLELWHCQDTTIEDVLLDGRDDTGTPVASSLLAYNFTTGLTTVNNLIAQYAEHGFAAALYGCLGNHVFNDCQFGKGCRKSINIEYSKGTASYIFNRCDFRGVTSVNYVAQISDEPGTGSCHVEFNDCIFPGDGIGRVLVYTATQSTSTIFCTQNGVDVTNDPTKFRFVLS